MNFSKQGFLQAFKFLNSGVNTKQANEYLLSLEQSPLCWGIALQLLGEASDQIKLYGATLINKKVLDTIHPSSSQLFEFLLAKIGQNINNSIIVNELCGAVSKVLVNEKELMERFIDSTRELGGEEIKLRVLKQIPISICCHTRSILGHKAESSNHFKTVIPLLIRAWIHTDLVLQVIENYSQFCKIDILHSEDLLNLVVSLPIKKTQKILNDFLSYSDRDNTQIPAKLGGYVMSFVNDEQLQQDRGYISLYIELCRYVIATPLNYNDLKLILYNMLRFVLRSRDLIADSGQFWMEITQKFHSEQKTQEERQLLCQALEALNNKVLELSILKKLIPRNTPKVIEIPSSDDEDTELGLEIGEARAYNNDVETDVMSFRQVAEDIFRMAFRIIRQFSDRLSNYFTQLYSILVKGELELELVLFNLKSIIDHIATQEEQNYVSTIVNMLVDHFESLPLQILIPFTQLLYDCEYIFTDNAQLTEKCLNIFLRMLSVRQVSKLLSQTVQNIVEIVCKSGSNTKVLLQNFVSKIFEGITDIEDDVVRDSILGALITLVMHQEDPFGSYVNLLTIVRNKIEQGLEAEKEFKLIHSVIFVHDLKVSDENLSNCFGKFVESIQLNIVKNYESSNSKNKTRLLCLLSKTVKKYGGNIPQTLVRLTKYFVQASLQSKIDLNYAVLLLASVINFYHSHTVLYSELISQLLPEVVTALMKEQKVEVVASYVALMQSLTSIEYPLDYQFVFSKMQRLLRLPFQYQIYRQVLKYFVSLVRKGIVVQEIMLQVMRLYHRIADMFHQQLMAIIIEGYKMGGEQVIRKSLQMSYGSCYLPHYQNLIEGLNSRDQKRIKNTLLQIKQ